MQDASLFQSRIYSAAQLPQRYRNTLSWMESIARILLLPLLCLSYIAALSFNVAVLATPPRFSLVLEESQAKDTRISWLVPGGVLWDLGIRAGDQVIALNHQPPSADAGGSWSGEHLEVRLASGETVEITTDVLRERSSTWPLPVISPWFFVFGLLVYWRAQSPRVALATFALFMSASFALAFAPSAVNEVPFAVVSEFIAVTLFAAFFLKFFLIFPVVRARPIVHTIVVGFPVGVCALALLSTVYPTLYPVAAILRECILLIYLLAGIVLLYYSQRRTTEPRTRRGLNVLSLGTILSVTPFVVLYLLPTVLERVPLLSSEYAILPLVVLPMSFTYATVQHNLFNIVVLQRWLIRGALWGVLIIPYILVMMVVNWLLIPLSEPAHSLVLIFVLVFLISSSFDRLYQILCRWIDEMVFKDNYNYRTALQQLTRDLSIARDMDTLGQALPATLQQLINVKFALLLIKDQDVISIHAGVGSYAPEQILRQAEALHDRHDELYIVHLPDTGGETLIVPLYVKGTVVGYLVLGPKANGERFRTEDRALLVTLSGQVAAIVNNAQLVDELHTKVEALDALNERLQRTQEEERSRLSADIHDEPLQTSLHLQRALRTFADDQRLKEPVALSQMLINQLRHLCTFMRPVTLEDLGLVAALDALAQEQSERMGLLITLAVDTSIMEITLDPAIELALYRAAQEAVNNCFRHAQASQIQITLRYAGNLLQLAVTDDGCGFSVPRHFSSLIEQKHLGLAGLQERVRRIGGQIALLSAPGEGTTLQVNIPLAQ